VIDEYVFWPIWPYHILGVPNLSISIGINIHSISYLVISFLNLSQSQLVNLGTRFFLRGEDCNNPSFWKIEINRFIKIPNFGDNKNFYFEYKINLLSFKTCEFEHLLPCFK
jgi:hypothetical protein